VKVAPELLAVTFVVVNRLILLIRMEFSLFVCLVTCVGQQPLPLSLFTGELTRGIASQQKQGYPAAEQLAGLLEPTQNRFSKRSLASIPQYDGRNLMSREATLERCSLPRSAVCMKVFLCWMNSNPLLWVYVKRFSFEYQTVGSNPSDITLNVPGPTKPAWCSGRIIAPLISLQDGKARAYIIPISTRASRCVRVQFTNPAGQITARHNWGRTRVSTRRRHTY
jgi:hypothetical protein